MKLQQILILTLLVLSYIQADEETILIRKVNECTLKTEMDYRWHVLTVRAQHPDYNRCDIGKDAMVAILKETFNNLATEEKLDTITSIFIGRLVDYPWLSNYLKESAKNDTHWDITKGKPKNAVINQYVGALLSQAEVIKEINGVLEMYQLKIKEVSVEKVLIDKISAPSNAQSGKVPYDAMVWLVIRPI